VDWQVAVVIAALTVALSYLSRSAWRTWFGSAGKGGCATSCGGCVKPADSPEDRERIALPRV
jgi:hypothetical protein